MEGADEAFRRFVMGESAGLLRTAWMLTGERAMAEDLRADGPRQDLAALVADLRTTGTPSAYVRTVMVRTFASWMGRRWNGEIPSEHVPETAVDDRAFAAADDRDRLLRALADLPRRQRAAVILRLLPGPVRAAGR